MIEASLPTHLMDMRSAPDGEPAGQMSPDDRNAMYVPFDVWYTAGTLMITCTAGAIGRQCTAWVWCGLCSTVTRQPSTASQ